MICSKAVYSPVDATLSFCSSVKKSIAAAGVGMLLLLLLLGLLVAMVLLRCAEVSLLEGAIHLLISELSITRNVA